MEANSCCISYISIVVHNTVKPLKATPLRSNHNLSRATKLWSLHDHNYSQWVHPYHFYEPDVEQPGSFYKAIRLGYYCEQMQHIHYVHTLVLDPLQ